MLTRPTHNVFALSVLGAVIGAAACGSGNGHPADGGAVEAPAADPRFAVFPASAGKNGPWMITPRLFL